MVLLAMVPAGRLAVPAWGTPSADEPRDLSAHPAASEKPRAYPANQPHAAPDSSATDEPASRSKVRLVHPTLDVWNGNGLAGRLADAARPMQNTGLDLAVKDDMQRSAPTLLRHVSLGRTVPNVSILSGWGGIYPHAPPVPVGPQGAVPRRPRA
jgi:hypothetical protein